MAEFLAREVKAGACTRMCAINTLRQALGCTLIDAVLAIDIAIGDVNTGVNESN